MLNLGKIILNIGPVQAKIFKVTADHGESQFFSDFHLFILYNLHVNLYVIVGIQK